MIDVRTGLASLMLALSLSSCLRAQDSLVQAVAGCWAVSMAPWRPKMAIDADSIYSTPPARIELQTSRGTRMFEDRGWLVRPAPGVAPSIHGFAYFQPLGGDSIRIAWSTGFSGLTMRLVARQDTLRGTAQTFWDFGRRPQTADVLLVRVPCH